MIAILLLLFTLSSVVISKILHKIVDPNFALSFSIKCFPIRLFGYIWPEEQKNLLGPVLHFILNPSKENLQESNTKLMSKTGRDLLSWSIKNEYVEIIRTILDIAGKVIKKAKGQINYRNSCFTVRLRRIFPILNSTISRSSFYNFSLPRIAFCQRTG